MKKTIQKIILFILIIILLFTLYSRFILKESLIKIAGNAVLVVITGSMEPEIMAGELIVIREVKNYQVGDIVTYREDENYLITHRIIEKQDNYLVTKGDNNNLTDNPIHQNQIEGKVIFHSKICGFFVLYLLKPITLLLILIILIKDSTFYILKNKEVKEKENKC